MQGKYKQILLDEGEEAARAYMRSLRSKVKTSGLANLSVERRKEIMAKVRAAKNVQPKL